MTDLLHHPAPEQLDRLRSGLLDNNVDAASMLEAHIRDCAECRHYLRGWTRLQELSVISTQERALLTARLKVARQTALASPSLARKHFIQPALAMAASVLLVAGLVTWNPWSPVDTSSDTMARHQEESGPDLYEDLDFYLWLAGHKEGAVPTNFDTIVNT